PGRADKRSIPRPCRPGPTTAPGRTAGRWSAARAFAGARRRVAGRPPAGAARRAASWDGLPHRRVIRPTEPENDAPWVCSFQRLPSAERTLYPNGLRSIKARDTVELKGRRKLQEPRPQAVYHSVSIGPGPARATALATAGRRSRAELPQ